MLKSRIPAIAADLEPLTREAIKDGARLVEQRAKARVKVDTGRLRNAIHVAHEPEGEYVIAGDSDTFYGHIVEHGSVHTPARPFLIPALEESKREVLGLAKQALRRAV